MKKVGVRGRAGAGEPPSERKPRAAGSSVNRGGTTRAPTVDAGDWRARTLDRARALISQADPGIVEEVKWRRPSNAMAGVAAWSRGGLICTGETYKDKVKLTFARGAAIDDPAGLFNASLDGGTRRAIDFHEGDTVNARAFKALIRAAVALNVSKGVASQARSAKKPRGAAVAPPAAPKSGKVRLLSGGNPQIAKAYGDEPVRAYISAMPGWKQRVGRDIDRIVERAVPGVRKAVKWNSPLYGAPGDGGAASDSRWFMSVHCFDTYVKIAFFKGSMLEPMPPGPSKQKHVRYLDLREHDTIDEEQVTAWVKRACALPGERM